MRGRIHGITPEALLEEIYVDLYSKARPKADFRRMVRKGEAKRPDFFMYYYLADDIQEGIVKEHCRRYNLDKIAIDSVMSAVMLGCAPNGNYRSWLKWKLKLPVNGRSWIHARKFKGVKLK